MNAIVNTDSVRGALAGPENSAIASETTKTANRLEGVINFEWVRPLGRYRADILQLFGLVFTILYLVGGVTLAGAILYYTFVSAKVLP